MPRIASVTPLEVRRRKAPPRALVICGEGLLLLGVFLASLVLGGAILGQLAPASSSAACCARR